MPQFPNDFNATGVWDLKDQRTAIMGENWPLQTNLNPTFQGSTSGYTSGGWIGSNSNIIDKFPFASDSNATDVGDITQPRRHVAGQQV